MSTSIIPNTISRGNASIQITPKGAVIDGTISPRDVEETITRLAKAETACRFAIGDLANYLVGVKGKDLVEIAQRTGLNAADLRKASVTCQRIPYGSRVEQLHFDYHATAASLDVDEATKWLATTKREGLSRKQLKKSIEIGHVASEEDMNAVMEDNDEGTESFGTAINRIVVLNGKLERDEAYSNLDPQELFDLHRDFLPVVKIWNDRVKQLRANGAITDEISEALQADLTEMI